MVKSTPDKDSKSTKWAGIKDRLAIAGAIVLFFVLIFMMFSGSIMNFQCSTWQFISFQCNRFDAEFKKWE